MRFLVGSKLGTKSTPKPDFYIKIALVWYKQTQKFVNSPLNDSKTCHNVSRLKRSRLKQIEHPVYLFKIS